MKYISGPFKYTESDCTDWISFLHNLAYFGTGSNKRAPEKRKCQSTSSFKMSLQQPEMFEWPMRDTPYEPRASGKLMTGILFFRRILLEVGSFQAQLSQAHTWHLFRHHHTVPDVLGNNTADMTLQLNSLDIGGGGGENPQKPFQFLFHACPNSTPPHTEGLEASINERAN